MVATALVYASMYLVFIVENTEVFIARGKYPACEIEYKTRYDHGYAYLSAATIFCSKRQYEPADEKHSSNKKYG